MAVIEPQLINEDGAKPTYQAADGAGDVFKNDGITLAHVKNNGGSAITVRVISVEDCNQGYSHPQAFNIPAGEDYMFANLEPERFNNDDGRAQIDYSDVTNVEIGVFKQI